MNKDLKEVRASHEAKGRDHVLGKGKARVKGTARDKGPGGTASRPLQLEWGG